MSSSKNKNGLDALLTPQTSTVAHSGGSGVAYQWEMQLLRTGERK